MIVWLGVLAVYFLPFPLTSGGLTVLPTFLGTLFIALGSRKEAWRITQNVKIFGGIFAFLLVAAIVAPAIEDLWLERLQTTGQLFLSLLLASIVFSAFARESRANRSKYYYRVLVVIITMAAIEAWVPGVNFILDDVRGVLYTRGAVSNIERDLFAYGSLRPILLTPEPSYLAYGVASILALFLLSLDDSTKEYFTFFALVVAASVIIRSPIVLLLPLATYVVVSYKRNPLRTVKGIVVAAFLTAIFIYGWMQVSDRLLYIMRGEDFSAFSRLLAPMYLLLEYFPQSLFVGAGLGGESLLVDDAREMFFQHGFARRTSVLGDETIVYAAMVSYFWQIWVYFGILGGSVYWFLVYKYVRLHVYDDRYLSSCILPIILFSFAGLLIGRMVALATWMTLLLLALELNHKFAIRIR